MSIIERAVDKLAERAVARIEDELAVEYESIEPQIDIEHPKVLPVARRQVVRGMDELVGEREVAIDFVQLANKGFLSPTNPHSSIGDELQMIKRQLLLSMERNANNELVNVVLLTSSVPGEGKTFMSINLALSMSQELDRSVILVDGDAARSGVTEALGVSYTLGLIDVLTREDVELKQALLRTNVPNLQILPSGQRVANTTEVLASNKMMSVVDTLAGDSPQRLVIFDGPPLLATTEASVLARIAGQVAVVVEEQKTSEANLNEALSQLDRSKLIGMILNKSAAKTKSTYYGYYKTP